MPEIQKPLTLIETSIAYRNVNYQAQNLFPVIRVAEDDGKFIKYDKSSFKKKDGIRAPGTRSTRITYGTTLDSYSCDEIAFHETITPKDRRNAPEGMSLDIDVTENLTDQILLNIESIVAGMVRNAANYSTDHVITLSGTSQFSDYNNSDPFLYINEKCKAVIQRDVSRLPNVILIPYEVALILANHPKVLERTKHTNPSLLTDAGLPEKICGLKVLEATVNEDVSSTEEPSLSPVWGKDIIIAYVEATPGQKKLSFGYCFVPPLQGPERKVKKWFDNDIESDKIEVSQLFAAKIISKDAGFLIKNAIA